MTVRNEELYLPRALKHLRDQGIEVCLIDNGSTDSGIDIAHSFLGKGVLRIEQLPYKGSFELLRVLENETRLAEEIQADWFIHYDADEIREASLPYRTLLEGIQEADRLGYNVINFDEFVFLPTHDSEHYENTDYVKEMRYYYFFEMAPLRRLNAWKNLKRPIDLKSSGGHRVVFEGQKIFPQSFILRHYIGLSKAHIIKKYGGRIYSQYEVDRLGWHGKRSKFEAQGLVLPSKSDLCCIDTGYWDKSIPWKRHTFLG
jgi:glycosyltransferase involved in cell wall biosynthesis